jgi:hypothetical protein
MNFLRCLILIGCCSVAGCSIRGTSDVLNNRPVDPLLSTNVRARVLIFVNNDCPIANRYCPEIARLHRIYAPRGVAFWLVHSDPEETETSVAAHDREYGLNVPVLLDADHSVARLAKAEVVPTAAVFTLGGDLAYHGRIDDRFAEIGRERPQASRHDLADALEAVLANRPVPVPATKPVGCYIPTLH